MVTQVENVKNFGIFNFMRKSKKYPFFKNVKVTNSSCANYPCDRLFYPFGIDNENYSKSWHSLSYPNSWIMMYLPKLKIHISSYSIKSYHDDYPVSWDLQVIDEGKWKNISTIRNNDILKSGEAENFKVDALKAYNTFRFIMNGQRVTGTPNIYSFEFFLIEFFGVIEDKRITNKCRNYYPKICFIISLIYS